MDDSAWPVAVFRWVLTNRTRRARPAAIAFSMQNFIGADGGTSFPAFGGVPHYAPLFKKNRNFLKTSRHLHSLLMRSEELDPAAQTWGTLALATTARTGVTHRTAWADYSWGDTKLDFHDDFSTDGKLEDRDVGKIQGPTASLAVRTTLPPHGQAVITFYLAWHFPNRHTWTGDTGSAGGPERVGNHYTTRFADAWDAIERFAPRAAELERSTTHFVTSFLSADLPVEVKEAALFNLSTLRSQTCFRTEDGRFYGFEGCHDRAGCCPGSCTHVWNYDAALCQLYPALARAMREVEFKQCMYDEGLMTFRVSLPLAVSKPWKVAAADGQMGCVLKLYREWRHSGDDAFLRDLWPNCRRALEFAWVPGGWDADRDGVMEGCQHNTMDVEYYGPNPQMQGWYLGALLAAADMAEHLGETDFAQTCADIFVRGSAWTDTHLFNGDYYDHQIRPPGQTPIHPGLTAGMGSANLDDPDLQLGAGCLSDQLAGQFVAHQCKLGHLLDEANVRKALQSVVRFNFRQNLRHHFNHMRSYALADESATLMCTYPRGRSPRRPFPYYNEAMTGFEYTAAVGLLQEGLTEPGLQLIRAVRARYDGRRRSPFDEAECGHHYARALAIWAAVPALCGTDYDARTGTLTLNPPHLPATVFWTAGDAWGTAKVTKATLTLHLGSGNPSIREIKTGRHTFPITPPLRPGKPLPLKYPSSPRRH